MLLVLSFLTINAFQGAEAIALRVLSPRKATVGTGMLIGPMTVLTAAHVVDGMEDSVSVRCGEDIVTGIVTRKSPILDLAMVELPNPCNGPAIAAVATVNSAVGSDLTVIGYPGGIAKIVTSGVVSLYDLVDGGALLPRMAMFSDAIVFPGNSGGPVVNDRGQIVGVVTGRICFSDPTSEQPGQCYSTSVPAELINLFLGAN